MQTQPVILFDLDGTLVSTTPRLTDEFHRQTELLTDLPLHAEDIREVERWSHYYWMPSPEYLADLQLSGGNRDREYWLRYVQRHFAVLRVPSDLARDIANLLVDRLMEFTRTAKRVETIKEDAEATLNTLKKSGFRIALLTNRDNNFPVVSLNGLGDYFETIVKAGEVGFWKPDPKIFRLALDMLGATAANAYYVGDNYYSDVLGAISAGLIPILVDSRGLFPEARCPVIGQLSELVPILLRDYPSTG